MDLTHDTHDGAKSEREERCGGTGLVSYWDGGAYIGEGCPGCIDCEPPDEELMPHPFNSRTPYEPGDDRDIWCKDCEYHREHQIHRKA